MDELEARIAELAEKEELDRLRPELDGFQVMAYLGITPGPLVKEALDFLLELRVEEGVLGEDEAYKLLHEWARERGIEPDGTRVPRREKPRDEE
jgi:poly(A) polymerase